MNSEIEQVEQEIAALTRYANFLKEQFISEKIESATTLGDMIEIENLGFHPLHERLEEDFDRKWGELVGEDFWGYIRWNLGGVEIEFTDDIEFSFSIFNRISELISGLKPVLLTWREVCIYSDKASISVHLSDDKNRSPRCVIDSQEYLFVNQRQMFEYIYSRVFSK